MKSFVSPVAFRFSSHLAAFFLTVWIIWWLAQVDLSSFFQIKKTETQSLSFIWNHPEEVMMPEKKRDQYAEANPSVPENIPEKTHLISSRNQQAAQLEKVKNLDHSPLLPQSTGDSDNLKVVQSQKAVHKRILKPNPIELTTPPIVPLLPKTQENKKISTVSGQGIKTSASSQEKTDKRIYLNQNNSPPPTPKQNVNQSEQRIQKPRPRLSSEILNGPILQKNTGSPRVGKVAIETRLSPFGIYMQEMLKAIEIQWGQLISNSSSYLQLHKMPHSITYRFTLKNSGHIDELHEIRAANKHSHFSELCRQAIASLAPFGEWNDKMIEEFGNSDVITITFNYK